MDFKFVQRGRLAASVWSLVTVCPAFGVTQHFSLTSSSLQNPARLFKSPDHSFKIQACSFKMKKVQLSLSVVRVILLKFQFILSKVKLFYCHIVWQTAATEIAAFVIINNLGHSFKISARSV